jgi:hypothetical protein
LTVGFYLDQDSVHGAVLKGLRHAGVDVLAASEAQMLGAPDNIQLEFATARGRAIYTANCRDYRRLHAEWISAGREHRGIICNPRQRLPVGEQIRALVRIDSLFDSDALRNAELFLTNFVEERA